MQKATVFLVFLFLVGAQVATGQQVDYQLQVPSSGEITDIYATGLHSGARAVAGPYDLDGDSKYEVILADYTGGGRAHVIENIGVDTWELVYSTPWNDSTATTGNNRHAVGADLDGDGHGEIIFFSGRSFSDHNPNLGDLPPGLYVYEHTGSDDDYGTEPASIYTFPTDLPDRWRTDQMQVVDVDGDGDQELLFGNNGADNRYDNWYILSVTGDIGSGFETWVEEARVSSRASEDFDPVDRGGGSAYAIHAADLDGNGVMDISMGSWNNFNFTNGTTNGANTYVFPQAGANNINLKAAPSDHVSLFGGTVVDINDDGDDEIFYPRWSAGHVSVLNYESGEDVLEITADQFILDLIPSFTSLGITNGDMDSDGNIELIGSGPAYTSGSYVNGNDPVWIRFAEYVGGDVESPASYELSEIEFPGVADSLSFDYVIRDSAGVMTTFFEDGAQGPEFVSKLAYLGDVDNDGEPELALAFQGVDDSTYVYNEVFNPADSTYTRTVQEARANPSRVFMRILSGTDLSVATEEDDIIVPSDYVLSPNYPNPFNPSTSFTFTLPIDKQVSVKIYDVAGRLVRTLVNNERYVAGTHQVTWDGRNQAGSQVASGTYLYTLEHGNFRQSRTMVMVK